MDFSAISAIFGLILIASIVVFGTLFISNIYIENENQCKSQGMELSGWRPDSVSCERIEDGWVVFKKFEKIDGKWYPVKEEAKCNAP